MLHQTWAYASTSRHSGFKNYNCNQLTMYQAIADAVKKAAKANKIKIVILRALPYKCAHLFHRRPPESGRLSSGCEDWTLYRCLYLVRTHLQTQCSRESLYPGRLDEARKAVAQKAAHAAVKHPYKVTDLSITN